MDETAIEAEVLRSPKFRRLPEKEIRACGLGIGVGIGLGVRMTPLSRFDGS
jgi:hypothetical protein